MSEVADDEDRSDRRQITKLKKNTTAAQNAERKESVSQRLQGHDVQYTDDVVQKINAIQHRAVKRYQSYFEGRMIRRTIASKNFEGESIISLKPYVHVDAIVRLQDWEQDVIREIGDRASEG
jgi:hypothetical protein